MLGLNDFSSVTVSSITYKELISEPEGQHRFELSLETTPGVQVKVLNFDREGEKNLKVLAFQMNATLFGFQESDNQTAFMLTMLVDLLAEVPMDQEVDAEFLQENKEELEKFIANKTVNVAKQVMNVTKYGNIPLPV